MDFWQCSLKFSGTKSQSNIHHLTPKTPFIPGKVGTGEAPPRVCGWSSSSTGGSSRWPGWPAPAPATRGWGPPDKQTEDWTFVGTPCIIPRIWWESLMLPAWGAACSRWPDQCGHCASSRSSSLRTPGPPPAQRHCLKPLSELRIY